MMNPLDQISMVLKRFFLKKNVDEDMIDNMLLEYDRSMMGGLHAVLSDDSSRPRNSFSGGNMGYSIGFSRIFSVIPVMMRLMNSFNESIRKATEPHDMDYINPSGVPEEISRVAYELGADIVGFTEVTPDLVYAGKEVPYKYAVVLGARMDNEKIATAPSMDCMVEVFNTYRQLGVLVNRLSELIIEMGYDAAPGHPLGGAVDYPSLARSAGLGEYGRHGLLISPYNGACQRLAAVYTNLELPAPRENPHMWVREFCQSCGKCVKMCPAKAIREKQEPREGGHYSSVIHSRCLQYFGSNYGCSICIKECPFTTLGYEQIRKAFMK